MTTTNPQPQPPAEPQQWSLPPKRHNGFGVAALVLGIVGFAFAWIPIFGLFIAWPCAVLAVVFGGIGMIFAFKGRASKGITIAGAVLGMAALVLSIVLSAQAANAIDDATKASKPVAADTSKGSSDSGHQKAGHKKNDSTDVEFGQTVKWQNGLTAKVLDAQTRSHKASDIGGKSGDRVVVFRVKLHNGADKSYDASLGDVKVNYGKDGDKATDVNAGMFDGKIAHGGSKTQKFAYVVPKSADHNVTMEVDPGAFSLDSALFSGSIKPVLGN
jgi:hypothetical protein